MKRGGADLLFSIIMAVSTVLGLELIMAGWLQLASADTVSQAAKQSALVCEPNKRTPSVQVKPTSGRLKYDFTKSRSELERMKIDTVSPYGPNTETHLNGAMSGSIQFETLVKYLSYPYENGETCVYVDGVSVKIHFDPAIYVVREYPKGSCNHKAVLEHEKKHLKVNQLVINKYAERISKTLAFVMRKYGNVFGPYPEDKVPEEYERLKKYYVGIVNDEEKSMYDELQKLHQDIDSLEEYERVRTACD